MVRHLLETIGSIIAGVFHKGETWFVLFLAGFAGILFFVPLDLTIAIWKFFAATWWLWLFILIWRLFLSTWMAWRQEISREFDCKSTLWEIQIPRATEKGAEAMETILDAFHSLKNGPGDPREKYWDGEIVRWFSFEIVSFGGEVHFYLRGYYKTESLIHAAFHAHYPDVELVEVEDYVSRFPQTVTEIYEQESDIWGMEMNLGRDPVYPLTTYRSYLNDPAEEKRIDPMATLLEVMGNAKPGEIVGTQIIFRPSDRDWTEKAIEQIEEYKEKTGGRSTTIAEDGSSETSISIRTPQEVENIKQMEINVAKPAFGSMIRVIYISPQATYYDSYPRRGVKGAFNQYGRGGETGNFFDLNEPMSTRAKIFHFPFLFPRWRVEFRKQRALWNYFQRDIPKETFMAKVLSSHILNPNFYTKLSILNMEAIASLFHIPTDIVLTTPHIKRVESRRAGPQSGLPIFGDEEEIEKYQ